MINQKLDLKKLTPVQILERKDSYMRRLEKLHNNICLYMDDRTEALKKSIFSDYADLKSEIKQEAIYLSKRYTKRGKKRKWGNEY